MIEHGRFLSATGRPTWALWPSRGLLLVIFALAPWAYGCIRWWVLPWFTSAMLGAFVLWIGGLVLRRRGPAVSPVLVGLAAALVGEGWLLVANAGYHYDGRRLQFVEVKPLVAGWLPGAIDTVRAIPTMFEITGLLGVVLIAADAARVSHWRRHLFWTVSVSGTLLAFYGLIQRFLPVPLLFWEQKDLEHNLFATFYYHGNAGAFFNLVLPFVFGAAVHGFQVKCAPARRAFGAAALFLNLAAAVTIASKAAQLVSVGLLAALLVVYRREIGTLAAPGLQTRRGRWTALVLASLGLGVMLLSGDVAQQRWHELSTLLNRENPRLLAYEACWRMLADAGPWGIGPGNFVLAFPHYTRGLSDRIMGVWDYAHEDYLQTVIEWGWVGAAVWTALLLGGARKGWHLLRLRTPSNELIAEGVLVDRSAWLAVAGVALHATVDFPLQVGVIQFYVLALTGLLWRQPPPVRERHAAAKAVLRQPSPLST